MNFLAHAYLSFNHKEILVGNMISDFVKGSAQYTFTPGIQNGIRLHRKIDAFTDAHPATSKAKDVFRNDYRLFSGVLVDIFFDHFLAVDTATFESQGLQAFTQNVYKVLEEYATHLPGRFLSVFTYMQTDDWLYNYQYKEGIEKSIRGIVNRSSFYSDSKTAMLLFVQHYDFLQDCFLQLFEDVKIYSKQEFMLLAA